MALLSALNTSTGRDSRTDAMRGAGTTAASPQDSIAKLIESARSDPNGLQRGAALRALDLATGNRMETDRLVRGGTTDVALAFATPNQALQSAVFGASDRCVVSVDSASAVAEPPTESANGTLAHWPVPGHTELNVRDSSRSQGGGEFGASRAGNRTHEGIDITAPVGSIVAAAGPGTVVDIQPNPSTSYGNQVVIDHGVDITGRHVYSQSAHLDTVAVQPGDIVVAGQQIGTVGRTGNTPADADPHLHFEVRIDGSGPRAAVVNPIELLPPQ